MSINGGRVSEPGHYNVFNAGKGSHCCLGWGKRRLTNSIYVGWHFGGKDMYLLPSELTFVKSPLGIISTQHHRCSFCFHCTSEEIRLREFKSLALQV